MSKAALRWLVIGLAPLVHTGCQNGEPQASWGPSADVVLESRGAVIEAQCVVTYYPRDYKTRYFSTQVHTISPGTNGFVAKAVEPEGELFWRLSGDRFESSIPPSAAGTLPVSLINRDVIQAIATCFLASAGYYDLSKFRQLDKGMVHGRWYQPLQPPGDDKPTEVTLFMLPEEGRVDMVRVVSGDTAVTVHAYSDRLLSEVSRQVPTRMDVFSGPSSTSESVRIFSIDYSNFNVLRKN